MFKNGIGSRKDARNSYTSGWMTGWKKHCILTLLKHKVPEQETRTLKQEVRKPEKQQPLLRRICLTAVSGPGCDQGKVLYLWPSQRFTRKLIIHACFSDRRLRRKRREGSCIKLFRKSWKHAENELMRRFHPCGSRTRVITGVKNPSTGSMHRRDFCSAGLFSEGKER